MTAHDPDIPHKILSALAPGRTVSGTDLARQLCVSRAAIWKQVRKLRTLGVPVVAHAGHSYGLRHATQMLDAGAVARQLPTDAGGGAPTVCWSVSSTQDVLLREATEAPDLAVVLSEMQAVGRGRRGRSWVSPPGYNIHLSCLKRFEAGFTQMSGLSLAVGVCVVRALQAAGTRDVGLKWPNDVVTTRGKLGGVLCELHGEYQGPCIAVVGVGVNVRLDVQARAGLGQKVVDLAELFDGNPPDRNALAAGIIASLRRGLVRFETDGLGPFLGDFRRLDRLRGASIRAAGPRGAVAGEGAGIDRSGRLLIATRTGRVAVAGGEVSVRWTAQHYSAISRLPNK